jgi:ABC-type dipeptide/oligopeptide/nickel transport system ATPase subunit
MNFYDKIPEKMKKVYRNPGYGITHEIAVPFRMIVVGASGTGKTNTVLGLINLMPRTFDHIIIFLKNADEPLYNFLAASEGVKDHISFHEVDDKNPVTPLEELAKVVKEDDQLLVIFDDLLVEKKSAPIITQYFIQGRKIGVSMIYVTQSWYQIPKTIRGQAQYVVFKKLSSVRDLNSIIRDVSQNDENVKELYAIVSNSRARSELDSDDRRVGSDYLSTILDYFFSTFF